MTFEELKQEIEQRLAGFQAASITLIDDSHRHAGHQQNTGGKHLRLHIVSTAFIGKNRLQRQRMVYAPLKSLFHTHIHALSVSAEIPDEM